MLIAFVSRARTQCDFDRLTNGAEFLSGGDVRIGAWPSAAGVRIDRDSRFVAEGLFAIDTALPRGQDLSVEDIRSAKGDFALMAATRQGLLVASGLAGGHRPIYVACTPLEAIASTHLDRVLSALHDPPTLDPDFLAHSAILEPPRSPELTPYLGVQKIPHGEAWLLRPGFVERTAIVRPLLDAEARGSSRDLAVMLREALEGALSRTLGDTRRVAIASSGGLDSSALVGIAYSLARKGTISAVPEVFNWDYDSPLNYDKPHFRTLEGFLGIRGTRIVAAEAVADFRRHLVIGGAPCYHPVVPFWSALARRARKKGIDVVISGGGGDQVMEGQPILLAAFARRGHPLRALRSAIRLRGPDVGNLGNRLQYVVRPSLTLLLPESIRRARRKLAMRRQYPWAGPKLKAYLDRCSEVTPRQPSLTSSPADRYEILRSLPMFDELWAVRLQQELLGGNVRRDPFVDDGFLRFVATLPPLAFLHGDYSRGLLREAMRGLVPDTLRLRENKAALMPPLAEAIALLGGFRVVEHLVDVRMLADCGLVEPRQFRPHFDRLAQDPARAGWLYVWAVLSAEAFLRHHAGDTKAALLG